MLRDSSFNRVCVTPTPPGGSRQGIALLRWTLCLQNWRQLGDPTGGLRLMDRQPVELSSRVYPHD